MLKGIKNIIFDLGGVLLNLDFIKTQNAFINLGVTNFDEYYSKAKQTGLFDLFETGKIDENEFCDGLRNITKLNSNNIQIITAWNAMLLDFPLIRKELLINLKSHFNTSLLSNTNVTHVTAFNKIIKQDIAENTLAPLFHSHYFSNEIGLRKPNAEAFEYVLSQNNFKAEETLFLDDSIQHIEGALKLGIKAIHIKEKPIEELFSDFLTKFN